MSEKKQGFVQGALILVVANIIVKVLGAFFKIPLDRIVGSEVMGLFSSAYSIYATLYLVSTTGLSVAVSRSIAKSQAEGREIEVARIFRLSMVLLSAIGFIGTAGMVIFAPQLSRAMGMSNLTYSITAVAPTLFFICISSAIRGYFQGRRNMIPTSISQVIEAAGKLIIGIALGWLAVNQFGLSRESDAGKIAALVISGVTIGVVLSALFLVVAKAVSKRDRTPGTSLECRSNGKIIKELITIAIPITITSTLMSLPSNIDAFLTVNGLMKTSLGMLPDAEKIATRMLGVYTGRVVTLFNLPPALILPFATSIIPNMTVAIKQGAKEEVKKIANKTFRVTALVALPCAVGLSALAKPILLLLFTNKNLYGDVNEINIGAPLLSILAISIILICMISTSNAMLQANGHEKLTVISAVCGIAVKIVSEYILIPIESIGILGVPLSTTLYYLVILSMNLYFLAKYTGITPCFIKNFSKPFVAAAVCGFTAVSLQNIIGSRSKLAVALSIVAAAVVYLAILFILRGITEEDLEDLPKGKTIYKLLKRIRLVK